MPGKNFALEKNVQKDQKNCVFISYKQNDYEAAHQIGEYLMNKVNVNIFLDEIDIDLQEAVNENNDSKIVDSIKKGIEISDYLLCLISDKTKLSWWVPYEIGFADCKEVNIVSLKLKGIDDLPSFLKIHKILKNMNEFKSFCNGLGRYGSIFCEYNKNMDDEDIKKLEKYIDVQN